MNTVVVQELARYNALLEVGHGRRSAVWWRGMWQESQICVLGLVREVTRRHSPPLSHPRVSFLSLLKCAQPRPPLPQVVHSSLACLQAALRGQAVMGPELEAVGAAMFDGKVRACLFLRACTRVCARARALRARAAGQRGSGLESPRTHPKPPTNHPPTLPPRPQVPALWLAASYPSLKPLGPYVADLAARLEMMSAWLAGGPPAVFWLGGFFFTHAFLTGGRRQPISSPHAPPQFGEGASAGGRGGRAWWFVKGGSLQVLASGLCNLSGLPS